jgi:hypothetical protein
MIKFKLNMKPKTVLDETKLAYCDSTMPWEKAVKYRNLSFRASKPVEVMEAVKIMTSALGLKHCDENGYNEFSPSQLGLLPVGSMVTLAREGSVCVYVTLPQGAQFTEKQSRDMKADEYHIEPDGTIRLWWD